MHHEAALLASQPILLPPMHQACQSLASLAARRIAILHDTIQWLETCSDVTQLILPAKEGGQSISGRLRVLKVEIS